jgi:hypothetical protein
MVQKVCIRVTICRKQQAEAVTKSCELHLKSLPQVNLFVIM